MTTEHLLLAGWPLPQLLQHAQARAPGLDRDALVQAWRQARSAWGRLVDREAGCADHAGMLPLPAAMAPQAKRLLADPALQQAHRDVPVALGLVETDALMTLQHVLAEPRLAALRQQVGRGLADPALAALCLPLAPVGPCGPAGQPHPVLHALKISGRLVLAHGHHRAWVLRASGAKFLPCLVSACDDLDDAWLAAPGLDRGALAAAMAAARPPMLRDFDRPGLVCLSQPSPGAAATLPI